MACYFPTFSRFNTVLNWSYHKHWGFYGLFFFTINHLSTSTQLLPFIMISQGIFLFGQPPDKYGKCNYRKGCISRIQRVFCFLIFVTPLTNDSSERGTLISVLSWPIYVIEWEYWIGLWHYENLTYKCWPGLFFNVVIATNCEVDCRSISNWFVMYWRWKYWGYGRVLANTMEKVKLSHLCGPNNLKRDHCLTLGKLTGQSLVEIYD